MEKILEIKDKLIIFCDGGSRGNPGEAAYGFVVYDSAMKVIYEEGKTLGIQTNNFAEYTAVIQSLHWVLKNIRIQPPKIEFFLDSKLAVEQLSGTWRVKSENIRELFITIKNIERKFSSQITYTHVRREKNKEADRMVNLALDKKI